MQTAVQVPQGNRRPGGQARRRPPGPAPRRGACRGRHPRDGSPRPHAAVGQRVRRLQGARAAARQASADAGREVAGGGRRVRCRPRVRAGGAGRARYPALAIPTIGIGAGPDCDAQVLVWQDMAGLTPRVAKFAKRYADMAGSARRRPCLRRGGRRWRLSRRRSTPTADEGSPARQTAGRAGHPRRAHSRLDRSATSPVPACRAMTPRGRPGPASLTTSTVPGTRYSPDAPVVDNQ